MNKLTTNEITTILANREDIVMIIAVDQRANLSIMAKEPMTDSIKSILLFEVGKQLCEDNAPVKE